MILVYKASGSSQPAALRATGLAQTTLLIVKVIHLAQMTNT